MKTQVKQLTNANQALKEDNRVLFEKITLQERTLDDKSSHVTELQG